MISSTSFLNRTTIIFFAGLLFLIGLHHGERGNESKIFLEAGESFLIAVLPMENLSGTAAPLREIRGDIY